MYAVTFDIDTTCLNDNYHGNIDDIRKFMEQNGFIWMQRSVYFGTDKIDAVQCVLTVQRLAKTYIWFPTCIRDIRMLRIEENNDLLPAIR
jgi:virulence-associated protein VapD